MTTPRCPTCDATDQDANPACRNAFHYLNLKRIAAATPTTHTPVHAGPGCACPACELERKTHAEPRVRRDPDGGRSLDGPGPDTPFTRYGTDPDDYR